MDSYIVKLNVQKTFLHNHLTRFRKNKYFAVSETVTQKFHVKGKVGCLFFKVQTIEALFMSDS